ncbi:hypothetical protein CAL26_23695 [Bordetella genomosp. 9]|uniref:N-acetyltransferase domain-containing protein n=1 Tax=Bordetella genomosp. 9 TaxID=1416803 RepID=A0A261R6C7_9BORD|nr:hypothetical protein [Bordetella genomosp. 9]OZI20501.1 hypothetical protein CAL26_23695 [Bordetella genomosp. 9]
MTEIVIRIQGVPTDAVPAIWPLVRDWIADALARGNSLDTPDDILAKIIAQEYQLWVVDDGQPAAAFVTRIYSGSLGSALVAVCLGGKGMDRWLFAVEDVICGFAKDKGCKRVYLHGRRGWVKQLAQYGWQEDTVNVMKEIA